jgi:putative ABC transport system substrate-binding protein
MNRRIFRLTIILLTSCGFAEAQQPEKIPRVGYLSAFDPARESTRFEAIRLALREMGYVEGQNIVIEYRLCARQRPTDER